MGDWQRQQQQQQPQQPYSGGRMNPNVAPFVPPGGFDPYAQQYAPQYGQYAPQQQYAPQYGYGAPGYYQPNYYAPQQGGYYPQQGQQQGYAPQQPQQSAAAPAAQPVRPMFPAGPAQVKSLSSGPAVVKSLSSGPAQVKSLSALKAEAPKTEAKAEPAKTEAKPEAKAEAKIEAPKVEAPKAEPKAEPKPDLAKGETPKPEGIEEDKAAKVSEELSALEIEDDSLPPELVAQADEKDHVNIIFIGHVDAGKSTMGGHILVLTGQVDKRTLEKYEREAKEKGRESWFLSWALDTNPEERDKGKTVEVGRGYFETEKKRYTILDAPGHKAFVPNMIGGAAQADVGILIISARKGEFEAGYEKGGQTREHVLLAKMAGLKRLIIAINKMDDPTVNWSEERYNDIVDKLKPYVKSVGFNVKTDIEFMPISGFLGLNLKDRLDPAVCSWYSGPSLLEYLDSLESIKRPVDQPLRMPITEKFKDMGTIVSGKLESGYLKLNQRLIVMPNQHIVEVAAIAIDEEDAKFAKAGDNVRLRLKGIEEDELSLGFVLCMPRAPCATARAFDAQLMIVEYESIIVAGFQAVMHLHACIEEVTIEAFLHLIDKKTGKRTRDPPNFVKAGQVCICRIVCSGLVCVERYDDFPQLGRFSLRGNGKTIAMGKVLKLVDIAPAAPSSSA